MAADNQLRQPVQTRAKRSRAKILLAGQREFSANGYGGTTAKSIAVRAGMSVGTFYQYYSDKDSLLRELASERQATLSARLSRAMAGAEGGGAAVSVRAAINEVVTATLEYHREDVGLHAVLTERRHADSEMDDEASGAEHAMVMAIEQLLKQWGAVGDHEALAYILFGAVEGTVHAHVMGHAMLPDDRLINSLVDSLVRLATPA